MKPLPEKALLLLLAMVQFTHIMDFMLLMPLGPQLMRELAIGPGKFSGLVAAYTLSAGIIGLLAAPFIDRFDRRPLLLFTYAGFTVGTLACGLVHTADALLVARALCGAFGGISGSLVMAVVSDLVPPARRATAMGVIMTSFSVAAAVGVPFGLYLAQHLRWEAPFFLLAGLSAVTWLMLKSWLPTLRDHVDESARDHFRTFLGLLRDANAGRALLFMSSMVFGHFMIIPFLSPFLVANVGLPEKELFLIYLTGGACTVFTAPFVGRLADRHGRLKVFSVLVLTACLVTLTLTHSGPLPLWAVLLLAAGFFVFASGRFVPGQAIMSLAVPASRRGSFMSLSSCARDLTMGLTSGLGGWIVSQAPSGQLLHMNRLGWLAAGAGLLSLWLGSRVAVNEVSKTVLPPAS